MRFGFITRIEGDGGEWTMIMRGGRPDRKREDVEKLLAGIESAMSNDVPDKAAKWVNDIVDESEIPKRLSDELGKPGCILFHQTSKSFILVVPKPGKWGLVLSVFDPIKSETTRCYLGEFDSEEKGREAVEALQQTKRSTDGLYVEFALVPYDYQTYNVGTDLKKIHDVLFQ